MAVTAAAQPGRGLQGFLRRVMLGGLLVAVIVLGLLAMHTLNLHGTPAAHAPATISVAASNAVGAHHSAAGAHESGGTASDLGGTCADCGGSDHLGMAMACVLALLLVLLILAPPQLLPGWMHTAPRPLLVARFIDQLRSWAPSLHVLCISRT